jgi:hypothetical protein
VGSKRAKSPVVIIEGERVVGVVPREVVRRSKGFLSGWSVNELSERMLIGCG